ncbi:TRAP transporter small permease [Pseudomonas sp. S31]|uniref:TRAP transporter small permease n=1 Tax=Pseudomonas sp. S31 TaxID=1564473 RepID=UPI0019134299|nr:TRAP transporter small permease [Pseudomonas sp. S31]
MNESIGAEYRISTDHGIFRKALERTVYLFALCGGTLLVLLTSMSIISIIGRKLFASPIRGDMELVEMGAAVIIASFLPLCELRGNHIKADAFTLAAPPAVQRFLDILAHLLCCVAGGVLTWRTSLQMIDMHSYGDSTTLLSIPMWIPLMFIVPSLALFSITAAVRVVDIIFSRGN